MPVEKITNPIFLVCKLVLFSTLLLNILTSSYYTQIRWKQVLNCLEVKLKGEGVTFITELVQIV